jgi:hypothetical protein
MSIPKDKTALRITDQHRGKHGMVYDMKSDGERLTLTIAAEVIEGSEQWRIEARSGKEPDVTVVRESDATRRQALARVAAAWHSRSRDHRLPLFDWEAVRGALDEVRAL